MNTLPTIHPLSETPLGRGPNGECQCNFCRHWYPIIQHIEVQLNDEGKKLFREYVEYMMYEQEEGDVAQAKLNGQWPGWEALKDFKPTYPEEDAGEDKGLT